MGARFKYNDGGRAAAGFVGGVADCVTRALATTTGKPYVQIRSEVLALAPDAETKGVYVLSAAFLDYARERHGLLFVPQNAPIRLEDLPDFLDIMALTENHTTVLRVGEVLDVFDCGQEPVRGYWVHSWDGRFNVVDSKGVQKNRNGSLNLAQAIKMRNLLFLNHNIQTWII